MDEDYGRTYGIEKLAELLIERGIEFFVKDEVSLAYKDDMGNWHECWMAGADENRVNALIVVTPEQLLSVSDLNGIITENEKLTEQCGRLFDKTVEMADENARLKALARHMRNFCANGYCEESDGCPMRDKRGCRLDARLEEIGIEVDG